jgi:hypothetical protein
MNAHHLEHIRQRLASTPPNCPVTVSADSLRALVEAHEADHPELKAIREFEGLRDRAVAETVLVGSAKPLRGKK